MIKKQINNWFIHFQKYFFKYKQGFYELSYIANSPAATIESYIKMPFFKHNKKHQTFNLSNLFMKVLYRYYKIEEGLWLSVSEVSIFKNIKINLLYDEFIDDKYYTLSLNFVNSNSAKISNLVNNAWPLSNMSWILIKPRENTYHLNFKDSNAKYIVFNFTEKWLQEQLKANGLFYNCNIEQFLLSDDKYTLFSDNNNELFNWYDNFNDLFNQELIPENKAQQLEFRKWSNTLLTYFANQFKLNEGFDKHIKLSTSDNQKIQAIENYLTKNLTNQFIGIEELAKLFFVSPTKLKLNFKSVYGVSIYQYYLSKQMILAHQLISEKNVLIKDVAALLGYDNVSKFTLAYKKHFGFLPSENY
jgi:AraC-like DNA-binding protein